LHPQATVGLNAHAHLRGSPASVQLARLGLVLSDQRVQSGDALHTLGQSSLSQPPASIVDQLDVVVPFGPVITHVQHYQLTDPLWTLDHVR